MATPKGDALLAAIPEGPQYDSLRWAIMRIARDFPEILERSGFTVARVEQWVAEINSGTGRDADGIRDAIFKHVVGKEAIMERYGVDSATADKLILGSSDGGMNFSDLPDSEKVDPKEGIVDVDPVNVGGTVIPQGARLVRIRDPKGSDAGFLYFLVYDWNGLELVYEIGDQERFEELFGTTEHFADFTTVDQVTFDNAGYTSVGAADQLYGAEESVGSQIERDIRELGLEDLPAWLRDSPEALAILAQAATQEWSQGRLWKELSGTQAFTDRFGDIIGVYTDRGQTIGEAVGNIVADEAAFGKMLREFTLPEGIEISNAYIHNIIKNGWTVQSAGTVLGAAEVLRGDEDSLARANAIMAFAGLPLLSEVDFINALQGHGPLEVIEALNTASAGVALQNAGLGDVDIELLTSIVDTSDRILTVSSFQTLAQQLAFNVIRFGEEIDFTKLGITRDDLIAAAFGESAPGGQTPGEVLNLLARFERDRQAASRGFEDTSAFLDTEGRLRIQGLGGL